MAGETLYRGKLDKHLAHLGYGARAEVRAAFAMGRVTRADGTRLRITDVAAHDEMRFDGEPLLPPLGVVIAMHKPVGYTCSTKGAGKLVFDLLPPRLRARSPALSTVGRLDRDTSGLLLLTDDGALLHRLIHPRSKVPKLYEATLARPLRGDEAEVFARGTLRLSGDDTPLLPARLEVLGPCLARLEIVEGRYHQVRRMFAAVGNHVEALHRVRVGGLELGDQPSGTWRVLAPDDVARL